MGEKSGTVLKTFDPFANNLDANVTISGVLRAHARASGVLLALWSFGVHFRLALARFQKSFLARGSRSAPSSERTRAAIQCVRVYIYANIYYICMCRCFFFFK